MAVRGFALGMQERSRAKVVAALAAIALGHLVSVAAVVALVQWIRSGWGFERAA
jgi:hypothetical protein